MRFLTKKLFFNQDFSLESNKEMKNAWEKYINYYNDSKKYISSNLINFYESMNYFHDAQIIELKYIQNDENKSDEIVIKIKFASDNNIYELRFLMIYDLSIHYKSSMWYVKNFGGKFDDIVLCEILYLKGKKCINFLTANGCEIEIKYNDFLMKK